MDQNEKIKLFQDVFSPKKDEEILFLIDKPHDHIEDNPNWKDRRLMAQEWYDKFQEMGRKNHFTVKMLNYKATGRHNAPIPNNILKSVGRVDIVIAMTEYSVSSSLLPLCELKGSHTRGASMPLVERRMEKTAFKADYKQVQAYAYAIRMLLDDDIGAKILFSTDDELFIDLRNRKAKAEAGDCTKPRNFINFPSGEGYISPYEAAPDEIEKYGHSKTEGIWPVYYDKEIIKYRVKENTIQDIIGETEKANEMKEFFNENPTRRNIAELGIGCNQHAVVTGNPLEDEKVGLHIAYGTSYHMGGKVMSDMHQDIIHAKGCPVEGITLTLLYENGSSINLIEDSQLRYNLLEK